MSHVIYFSALAILWAVGWSATAGVLAMFRGGTSLSLRQRKATFLLVAFGVLLVGGWLLGYAPYRRLLILAPQAAPAFHMLDDLFVPQQWAFDHTPFRGLLLRSADFWNVPQERFLAESQSRMLNHFWGTTPPWLYASAWILFGSALLVIPPWAILAVRQRIGSWRNPTSMTAPTPSTN